MVKVLVIMHHITLYTPCIALVNGGHLLHIRVYHADRKRRSKRNKSKECSEVHKPQVVRILS
jgi:hypothetical protein